MKRRLMALLTALVLMVSVAPVHAAAATNVTKKMSGDSDLKQISKMFAAYTTAMNLSGNVSEKQIKVPLDDANQLSISAFVRYNYKDDFGYTAGELKKETKNLFGRAAKANVLKKADHNSLLVCESEGQFVNDPYVYCGGDFSDCIPKYKIKKVVQIKKNMYQIEIQNKMSIYGEKGSEDMGRTILKVQKDKTSEYGYIVKDVMYRK